MEKHLLVTVSEQKDAQYGVQFAGHFFSNKQDLKVTLFYTTPRPPALWTGEKTLERVEERDTQAKQYRNRGQKALERAKRDLIRYDFDGDRIESKLQFRQFSKVDDIIQEGEKGLYDAVVLGRRGLTLLEAAFDESVTRGIFEQRFTFPVWMCRMPDLKRKNVLLCLDGSDTAYRIADHVGFILNQEEGHGITIFVVAGNTLKDHPETVAAKSRKILLKNGLSESLIREKVVKAGNAGKAILKETEEERYAAVAMGRSGQEHGLIEKLFKGPVCSTLFKDLQGAALWMSR